MPERFHRMRSIILILLAALAPLRGAIIVTTEVLASSSASFTYQSVLYSDQSISPGVETASTQALAGNANTPEGRTAARVSTNEIAANARLDGKLFFAPTNIQDNGSILTYTGTIMKLTGASENILLDFYLPPSYVETTTNAEIPYAAVNPAIFASIEAGYCSSIISCGPATELFEFQAYLDSTFNSYSYLRHATGQAGLDLTPLLNPVVTDTYSQPGFFRTANMEFPGYAGTVDLGSMSVGQILRFTYRLEARALGYASANVGIAAINDPFFLSSDPVLPGAPIAVTSSANGDDVPEPGTFALLASGLVALTLRATKRRG
jgi:hypothetical protein